ncbi:Rpn family recombination-promoting nuclease/putative transposase [Xylocopilactobacillus apis]|uniref:Rpn family recombination-promoting nuclease/putative transposase n=1 Tax=Xylocopilactobacillus apis TaxID=2932183 RepID=A0AAU9D351_9LACO|nr:Rpn family recombination-promoting nuclease/putative transposase [Xylocopilactobacillus apis]BDR55825.1 hypothetical protein KIMC2_03870 [Xylocopilactobacillus apis]
MIKKTAPSSDLQFKKLFGSPENEWILVAFINDLLDLDVESAKVGNPYNIRSFHKNSGLQVTEVDVIARLADGTLVTIEMQIAHKAFFIERLMHYLAEKYSSNFGIEKLEKIKNGRHEVKYSSLRPVYSINILYYNQFQEDDEPLHTFVPYDIKNKTILKSEDGRPIWTVVTLELLKPSEKLKGNSGYWHEFLKKGNAANKAPKHVKAASKIVEYTNLSKEEQAMLDAAQRAKADQEAEFAYQWIKGEQSGIAKGEKSGIAKGRQEGIKEGVQEGIKETARKMLKKKMSFEDIQELTGLTQTEVEKLSKE